MNEQEKQYFMRYCKFRKDHDDHKDEKRANFVRALKEEGKDNFMIAFIFVVLGVVTILLAMIGII